jgi:hypothetical protein
LLECGAQVTGAYFPDPGFKDVPDVANVGFPIAEVAPDGDVVITKAANTGGLVSRATVIEQLLYEVHDPHNYLTPDVILDIGDVTVEEVGADRVRVQGARGTASSDTQGDRQRRRLAGEGEISYLVPMPWRARSWPHRWCLPLPDHRNHRARARGVLGTQAIFDNNTQERRPDFRRSTAASIGCARQCSASRKIAQQVADEVLGLYCSGPAGGAGPPAGNTADRHRIDLVSRAAAAEGHAGGGGMKTMKFLCMRRARAGDKGNRSNISVIPTGPRRSASGGAGDRGAHPRSVRAQGALRPSAIWPSCRL